MSEFIKPAGELLLKFLESEQGRKTLKKGAEYGLKGFQKGREAVGAAGAAVGNVLEEAAPQALGGARNFAQQYVKGKGLIPSAARTVAGLTDEQIGSFGSTLGNIARNPVSQGVAVAGTAALVGGALSKPDSYYSLPMQEIAAREAAAYGLVDAKLAADTERQLGNSRLAQEKFEQSLYLQNQRQQHEMMMASARQEARTPRNQPKSGAGLFDPMDLTNPFANMQLQSYD